MKFKLHRKYAFLIPIVLLVILLFCLRRSTPEPVRHTTVAMGSVVTQTLYGKGAAKTAADTSQAIASLESRISCKLNGTEIAALNQTGSGTVSPDTAQLLTELLALQARTDGRYCITVRPLSVLWDFDAAEFTVPDASELAEAVAQVQNSACTVSGNEVLLRGALDLGSAGKGAACDTAVAVYRENGLSAAIVAVGGSIGLYGEKPDHAPWSVAVRDPDGDATDSLGILSLDGGFVSTSGTYEKVREAGGVRYHHLLDPTTGYPADSGLVSVTVVCDSGAMSDALATACAVLGAEAGSALLTEYGAEYLLIDRDHRITVSAGLADRFSCTDNRYTVQIMR